MTEEQLKEGTELLDLISKTRSAFEEISRLLSRDDHYYLTISQHQDGSGMSSRSFLYRTRGNKKLLSAIKTELESQLAEYEDEFAAL